MNTFEREHYVARPGAARFSPPRNTAIAVACGLFAATVAGAAAATQAPAIASAAAFLIAVAGAAFILRHPAVLLWSLVLSAPFNDYLTLTVGGLNIRPYAPLAFLGAFWMIWLSLARKKSRITEIAWYYKGMIFIVALLLAAKILTIYSLTVLPPFMTTIFSVKFVMFIGLQFVAAFVCASFIDSPERLHTVLRAWIHVSNIVCFVAFIQLVLANVLGMNKYVWHREIISIGRPYSVFREPDVLGCYYASFIVMLIPFLVGNVKFVHRAYLWLTLLTHGLFFFLIVVRAAWVAVACCLALYLLLVLMTRRYNSVMLYLNGALAAAVVALAGAVTLAPASVEKSSGASRVFQIPKQNRAARTASWNWAINSRWCVIRGRRLGGPVTVALGHGDFSWSYWAPAVIPEDDFDQEAKKRPRGDVMVNAGFNMPLTIQFDNGLLGLALYGAFFLTLTAHFLRSLQRTKNPERQALLLGTFLPVVAVLICYQFSYDPLFLTLWILLGFHLAAAYHVNRIESGVDEIGIPEPV